MAKSKTKLKDPSLNLDDYGKRSIAEAWAHRQRIEGSKLEERQEARAEFGEAMKDPALIAERIGWLIDGNYGHGEMLEAKRIVASPRMNRRAGLCQLVGVYEWQCPVTFGIQAWQKLSAGEKKALDDAIDVVIEAAEAEMAAEQGA